MVKVAKIVNKYGKTYMVPLWRAKKMIRNEQIDDFDIIEVDKVRNFEKPHTKKEFENSVSGTTKSVVELENEALKEQIALLGQKEKLVKKEAPKIEKAPVVEKVKEIKEEIKIPETPVVKKPNFAPKK